MYHKTNLVLDQRNFQKRSQNASNLLDFTQPLGYIPTLKFRKATDSLASMKRQVLVHDFELRRACARVLVPSRGLVYFPEQVVSAVDFDWVSSFCHDWQVVWP